MHSISISDAFVSIQVGGSVLHMGLSCVVCQCKSALSICHQTPDCWRATMHLTQARRKAEASSVCINIVLLIVLADALMVAGDLSSHRMADNDVSPRGAFCWYAGVVFAVPSEQ